MTYEIITQEDLQKFRLQLLEDLTRIMSGAMQAVSPDGYIFLESTPNGATGMFYQEVQKAINGDGEFMLHFYAWFMFDEYRVALEPGETLDYTPEEQALVDKHALAPEQIKWRRRKMREPEMDVKFIQEYPEDPYTCFLTSGDSAFPGVQNVMGPPVQTTPNPTHRYVAGLDWGQDPLLARRLASADRHANVGQETGRR